MSCLRFFLSASKLVCDRKTVKPCFSQLLHLVPDREECELGFSSQVSRTLVSVSSTAGPSVWPRVGLCV